MAAFPVDLLLIEDNESYATLVVRNLESLEHIKFGIRTAGTLVEGLKMLDERPAHLILLDLLLPDSGGLDTFKKIHNHFPGIPVIVLTAVSDEENAVKAVQLGAQDYLIKGETDKNQITRSIRYALERQKTSTTGKRSSRSSSRRRKTRMIG